MTSADAAIIAFNDNENIKYLMPQPNLEIQKSPSGHAVKHQTRAKAIATRIFAEKCLPQFAISSIISERSDR